MGVLNRLDDLQQELEPIAQADAMRVAPRRQWLTLHILQRKVGQSVRGDPGVVQPCDVGMFEARENVTLALIVPFEVPPQPRQFRQLQGHLTPVGAVGAARQPDLGHGFRQAQNIARAMEAELYFLGKVFGFDPADAVEPVLIDNLDPA